MSTPPLVGAIDHIGLTVPDLDAAIEFYTKALGGRVLYKLGPFDSRELSEGDADWTDEHVAVPDALYKIAFIGFGEGRPIEFFEYQRPAGNPNAPKNNDVGGHHIAFTVSNLAQALEQVLAHGGTQAKQPIPVPAGEDEFGAWDSIEVNYVLDPFGNQLELVQYMEQN